MSVMREAGRPAARTATRAATRTPARVGAALLAASALAGCSFGTGPDASGPTTRDALFQRLGALVSPEPQATNPRDTITRARLDVTPTPILLLEFERTGQGVTLAPGGRNRGVVQWRDAQGGGVALREGVLIATYGLGFDLHGADVDGLLAALRSGGGRVSRVDTFLRGDVEVVARRSVCDVVPKGAAAIDNIGRVRQTRVFDEVCEWEGGRFSNRYWVESDGLIRRSVQQIDPRVGAVRIELLNE
jgi:hypothetical protein